MNRVDHRSLSLPGLATMLSPPSTFGRGLPDASNSFDRRLHASGCQRPLRVTSGSGHVRVMSALPPKDGVIGRRSCG
jgi:LSD1 subclass zinc finger protein